MNATEPVEMPAAPKKRKYTRRKKLPAAAPRQQNIYTGISVTECPAACGITGCVISGNGICAHPRKGGLRGRSLQDNAALARLEAAKKMIGKKLLTIGGSE